MGTFKDYQFEVNKACKGEVSKKGTGFKITYSPDSQTEDMQSDIQALQQLDYKPVVSGMKKNYLVVPLSLGK